MYILRLHNSNADFDLYFSLILLPSGYYEYMYIIVNISTTWYYIREDRVQNRKIPNFDAK